MALWYSETYAERVRLSLEVDRVLHSSRSRFQTIEIVEAPATGKTLILADVSSPARPTSRPITR
jgi:spermidine synthase